MANTTALLWPSQAPNYRSWEMRDRWPRAVNALPGVITEYKVTPCHLLQRPGRTDGWACISPIIRAERDVVYTAAESTTRRVV
jgi:hypothetical protein